MRTQVDVLLPGPDDRRRVLTKLTLRDVSVTGISVMYTKRLEKGAKIALQLQKDDGGVMIVEYEVRRCVQATPGLFLIGAALTDIQNGQAKKSA